VAGRRRREARRRRKWRGRFGDPPEDEKPRPVVRALGWVILACLTGAAILGLSRYGDPVWRPARALAVPAGALMVLQSTLLGGRRAHPMVAIPAGPMLAPGVFVCGLGFLGLGLEHLDPARPWTILAIPMIVLLGLLSLREARRGRRSVLLRERGGGWHGFLARAGLWMFGLCWPLFVLWALGVVRLDD
jgi:hypothetical protein